MKSLLKEYTEEEKVLTELEDDFGNKYAFLLDERKNEISFASKTGSNIKGFKDFLGRHPFMTSVAVAAGLGALDRYQSNKRQTTRLFAQNQIEKRLYSDMAKELEKTGKYTILKNGKRIKDGWLWELKRRGSF